MRFHEVNWLWGLTALPLVWFLLRYADGAARNLLGREMGPRADEHVEYRHEYHRQWRRFFVLNALLWLVIALARPQWGAREIEHMQRGVDVVIALDVSNSMRAEDVAPNRLSLAKAELAGLLEGYSRGRVGLVLFAGQAFVQCPLTLDLSTMMMFLRMADTDMISTQGTAIGPALSTAAALLGAGKTDLGGGRVILLVTDGEDLEGDWQQAAETCRDEGIVVMGMGVGSPQGGLIPELGPDGTADGFLKDEQGSVVMSRLDMDALQQVAALTGGRSLRIGTAGLDRQAVLDRLGDLDERDLSTRRVSEYTDRYVWPLLVALVSLLMALASLSLARRSAVLIVAMFLLAGIGVSESSASVFAEVGRAQAEAGSEFFAQGRWEEALAAFEEARKLNPDDPRLSLAVGETLNKLQRYEDADREFQRARALTDQSELQAESLYNAGTNHLQAGEADKAVAALLESLALDPGQQDALNNLEQAYRLMKQPPQQDQQNKDQQDQKDQKDQQDQQDQKDQKGRQDQENQQQEEQDSGQEQELQESPQPDDAEQNPDSDQKPAEGEQPPADQPGSPEQAANMDKQRALDILKSLDRDEEELRKAIQQRLKGQPVQSGKRW